MPEPIAVLPNLYQLIVPTPFPVGPVNVYVAVDPAEGGLTLVDCGPRTVKARMVLDAELDSLGYCVRHVRRILVTHAHADHHGLAAPIADESGAQVLTHPFNWPSLEAYDEERDQRLAFYDGVLRMSGVPNDLRETINRARRDIGDYASAVPVSGELNDGDTVTLAGRTWQVLHTPGHSAGLVCLYEPESHTLLSNDHLLRDISSNPLVEPPPPGHVQRLRSLVEYIRQMQRVAAMDISVAWPGHGEPIYNVPDLVRQRIEFHARRAGHILEILDGSAPTIHQIARQLFPDLDPLNFFLAISEVLGHLELLESEGRVIPVQRDGVLVWRT